MEEQQQPGLPYHPGPNRFVFFAGVIMPTLSITLEATTHICANVFFDPIPTIWHLLLVVFVPLAQLHVWLAIRRRTTDSLGRAGFLNAVVIGISIFYSIVYVPLLPLSMLALLFGVGLLPLAPYLSLLAGVIMRYQLRRVAATAPRKSFAVKTSGLLAGLALIAAIVAVVELPAALTTIGLQMATASSSQKRADGIRFLRKYGSKDALLRSCYSRSGWATDLIGSAFSIKNPVTPHEAQMIYYRVTGEAFDTSIPPQRVGVRLMAQDTVDFDTNQGGTNVGGGKLSGLSLVSSELNGKVDADGGVGYTEWTLIFKNDSDVQREARAEVQLPPGGVVSRLTLWVNGEEREAAFAGRSQVRAAYEQVAIRQRRDPVLVTTSGHDRVLVQCFPVPPSGGEMKIRFGITAPILLYDETHAKLLLPHFVFRNFGIAEGVRHAVWIQGKTTMWPYNSAFTSTHQQDTYTASGMIGDELLSDGASSIALSRSDAKQMWSKDPFDRRFAITQSIVEHSPAHVQRIVLVVDTSATMQNYIEDIRRALRSLPFGIDVKFVVASSELPPESVELSNLYVEQAEAIVSELGHITLAGGADNAPALLKAWEIAAQKPGNNAIIWIHSPQPLLLSPVDELKQRWAQRPYGPTLYSVQTASGSDEIEKKLDGVNEVKSVPRTAVLQDDLENLFGQLTGRVKVLEFVRSSRKLDKQIEQSGGVETSDHLARLWANDEVARILAAHDTSLTDEATLLASRYQLVTPVTGAVVLETAEQYRASGLEPVNAGTVPTIPEPEMVALLLVAAAFLVCLMWMKYRKAGRGNCTV
jgi:hypothetical protein